jgi:hypothetical protein
MKQIADIEDEFVSLKEIIGGGEFGYIRETMSLASPFSTICGFQSFFIHHVSALETSKTKSSLLMRRMFHISESQIG